MIKTVGNNTDEVYTTTTTSVWGSQKHDDAEADASTSTSSVADTPPRVVCMCVDASIHSKQAFQHALRNIFRPTDKLVLVTVVIVPAYDGGAGSYHECSSNMDAKLFAAEEKGFSLLRSEYVDAMPKVCA